VADAPEGVRLQRRHLLAAAAGLEKAGMWRRLWRRLWRVMLGKLGRLALIDWSRASFGSQEGFQLNS
jgi:hypothetical protein